MAERPNRSPRCAPAGKDDSEVDRAFGSLVAYEKPRRLAALAMSIYDVVHLYCGEYIATQPIRIDRDHPNFGQAARCGEILTGCDAKDVVRFEIDPSKDGPLKEGEIATVVVMVATRDQRWHEARDLTVDRLVGAWLDARR